MLFVYVACPRDLGVASVLCFRIPSLIGISVAFLGRPLLKNVWATAGLTALIALSTVQVLIFHSRFSNALRGLDVVATADLPRAWFAFGGPRPLGSHVPYLEHYGEWVTAWKSGGGLNFFADAPQQPVQRVEPSAQSPDPRLWTVRQRAGLKVLYTWGEGDLPPEFQNWCEDSRSAEWRRFKHCEKFAYK